MGKRSRRHTALPLSSSATPGAVKFMDEAPAGSSPPVPRPPGASRKHSKVQQERLVRVWQLTYQRAALANEIRNEVRLLRWAGVGWPLVAWAVDLSEQGARRRYADVGAVRPDA